MKKIKVLVIDDSAVVRQTLSGIISADPHLEVVATAADPYIAAERMKEHAPDVITLDVEMPRMDGITFLHKLMGQRPVPTIIVSSLAGRGSETALKALEYGAVDIIQKPHIGTRQFLEESRILLCDAIKAAAVAKINPPSSRPLRAAPRHTADAVMPAPGARSMIKTTEKVVIVGASTGGTEAVKAFLQSMPLDCPGIVVVLHMPEKF
ncbi:MAG: response regulator, partial [Deltaproteobacteria bacterium]|nr:response regulator [Deltaproteobacteria bacterium]